MRAHFRDALPFGGSLPWWIAVPGMVLWGAMGIFFWICAGVWIVARFMTQHAQRGWRALHARRAA